MRGSFLHDGIADRVSRGLNARQLVRFHRMTSFSLRSTAISGLLVAAAALFAGCPPPTNGDGPPPQECPATSKSCTADRTCGGGFCDKTNDSADGTGDGIP